MAEYLNSNVKHLRTQKNISQQNLADEIGVDRSTISRIENDEIETTIDNAIKIAKVFEISLVDLINKDLRFDNADIIEIEQNVEMIPVYGTIKAGIPIESQTDIIDYIDIPKSWAKNGKKYYGLKISGDSMSPKYQENDIVVFEFNEDVEQYKNKDVAVMINGTESTFKKILINEQGIVLVPYNNNYDMMMFSKEQVEQLPIKVVGIAREKRTKIE